MVFNDKKIRALPLYYLVLRDKLITKVDKHSCASKNNIISLLFHLSNILKSKRKNLISYFTRNNNIKINTINPSETILKCLHLYTHFFKIFVSCYFLTLDRVFHSNVNFIGYIKKQEKLLYVI
jgi:hypothetical protein